MKKRVQAPLTSEENSSISDSSQKMAFTEKNGNVIGVNGEAKEFIGKEMNVHVSNGQQAEFAEDGIGESDHVPYMALYDHKSYFKNRGFFIPSYGITISIVKIEENTGFFCRWRNPHIYTIELQHGPHQWTIKRRFSDFKRLAHRLRRCRTAHLVTSPFRRKKQNQVFKEADENPVEAVANEANVLNNSTDSKTSEKLRCLDSFPKIPGSYFRKADLDQRKKNLETFLNEILKVGAYRDHKVTAHFLGVSRLSFIDDLGCKGSEGMVLKRLTGLCYPGNVRHCCINDFCNRKYTWLAVKESYVLVMDYEHGSIRDVMMFDRDFVVRHCQLRQNNYLHCTAKKHLFMTNQQRPMGFTCNSESEANEWQRKIEEHMANEKGAIWCRVHRFGSTYPIREEIHARWLMEGRDLMECAADMMEMAKEEIFITSWCFHPQIFLKRIPFDYRSRLDFILKRKAEQGVKIFILLFREFPGSLTGTGSKATEKYLLKLHRNIKVMRHPRTMVDWKPGWTNHEKIVVVDQKIALQGGIDFAYNRWDDHEHRLIDLGTIPPTPPAQTSLKKKFITFVQPWCTMRTIEESADSPAVGDQLWPGKDYNNIFVQNIVDPENAFEDLLDRTQTHRSPWHDMGCIVYGVLAQDVARHFIQRWNGAKIEITHENNSFPFILPKAQATPSTHVPENLLKNSIPCNGQLLRTSAEWSASHYYTEVSIYEAYLKVIEESQHFIYIENPFFISKGGEGKVENKVSEAIYNRIVRAHENNEVFRVYIVIPLIPGGVKDSGVMQLEMYYIYLTISHGEESLMKKLERAVGDPSRYISFCSTRTHGELSGKPITEIIYGHNKLLLVDDRKALIGSANIGDRSFLGGRDSEAGILFEDTHFTDSLMNGRPYKSGEFAGSLRRRLFSEHLGLLSEKFDSKNYQIDITDPISDEFFELWNRIASTNTEIYQKVFNCAPSDNIKTLAEWTEHDKQKGTSMANTNTDEAKKLVKNIQGYLVRFPIDFLSESDIKTERFQLANLTPQIFYK